MSNVRGGHGIMCRIPNTNAMSSSRPKVHVLTDLTLGRRISFVLLLLLIVAAPLSYGGVTQFGVLLIQLLAFAALAVGAFGRRRSLRAAVIPVIAVLGIAFIGVVQLLPIDAVSLRAISPTTASIYADANATLAVFGAAPVVERLSIAPTETVRAALLIAAYVALFITAFFVTRTRLQRRFVLGTLLAASIVHVGYAALTQQDRTAEQYADRMHGLFVNPNHFAGYLQIALAIAFAFIWTEVLTGRDRLAPKMERAIAIEKRMIPLAWRIIAWVVIAVGIGFSESRMGIVAAALTLILLLILSIAHQRSKQRRLRAAGIAFGLIGLAIVFVGTITKDAPLVRFLAADPRDPAAEVRSQIWSASVDAWKQFPHLGSGLGTFREAFRRVQPPELAGMVEQAHSDPLQLLVTGGWVSFALGLIAVAMLFVVFIRGWAKQQHREESAIALAAVAALFALVVHGLAEFNFSIPAIPATLAVVLGVGWSAATYEEPARQSPEGF